ncbi:MAG: transglycosylase SLT domain-containing protein [Deltaproteobacteria bacterium]|nr:transglycosylase SLT domain-containing protein [Deltaproteobacteria bacterium]
MRIFLLLFITAFLLAEWAAADIYVHRDSRGVMTFTNAPSHSGYRVIIRNPSHRGGGISVSPSFEQIVRSASNRYGVDPNLVWAVMKVESNFDPYAVSKKGARGLMQLMPATARQHRVDNIHDPGQNIQAGVRHLRLLLDRFKGNLRLGLAAYNAGSRTVERYKNIPPYAETRQYVRRVLKYYDFYRRRGPFLTTLTQ